MLSEVNQLVLTEEDPPFQMGHTKMLSVETSKRYRVLFCVLSEQPNSGCFPVKVLQERTRNL